MPTQNIYDLVDTWNNSATTFTAVKMNVTDTASAAASLLMDLQVGGSSKFKVDKAGVTTFADILNAASSISVGARLFIGCDASTQQLIGLNNGMTLRWGSGSTVAGSSTYDLILSRRAAANLRLGAADTTGTTAPTAQTLSVQSWTSSTNNNQPGANFTIAGSQGTGTGAGGSIIFQVAPAGAVSNGVQNALQNALLIDGDGQATFTIKNTSGTPSLQIAKSGSSSIQITTSATFSVGSSASSLTLNANAGSSPIYAAGSYFNIGTAANNDVQLYRDAANTLALRNGANAQTFRVYNTWTSFGSGTEIWERGKFAWESNVLTIGTEKGANGGTARALELQADGVTRLTIRSSGYVVETSGSLLSGAGLYANANNIVGWDGRSIIKSEANGLITFLNQTQTDFDRLRFGGTTSSFPALKRNSTALETKLADDSAYAPHAMQYLDVTDGVTAPASATGRARIYVDTADGDLKVIFADGTVKTIVTDT